ncbi:hypothetical protein V8E36_008124 [Tilletia maclaganii]
MATTISNDLEWLLVRNTSSFVVKQKSLPKSFSREPRNLANIHSFNYSTTTNKKAIGVEATKGGVVVSSRKSKASPNQVKGAYTFTTIKKGGSRRSAGIVSNLTSKNRAGLTQLAVARASAVARSERSRKTKPASKPRGKKAAAAAAPAPAAEETA